MRQSFTRAAQTLYDSDTIKLWIARWPSKVTLIAGPDVDPSDADFDLARLRHIETYDHDAGRISRRPEATSRLN